MLLRDEREIAADCVGAHVVASVPQHDLPATCWLTRNRRPRVAALKRHAAIGLDGARHGGDTPQEPPRQIHLPRKAIAVLFQHEREWLDAGRPKN